MPNTSSKALARIRATYEAQQAALNAKRRQQLAHPSTAPPATGAAFALMFSLCSSNCDALTAQEEQGIETTITPVSNAQFFNLVSLHRLEAS